MLKKEMWFIWKTTTTLKNPLVAENTLLIYAANKIITETRHEILLFAQPTYRTPWKYADEVAEKYFDAEMCRGNITWPRSS